MESNLVAIVTGGASGLGLATATLLHEKGHKVIVFDKNQQALEKLPSHFKCFCIDITEESEVCSSVNLVLQDHASIDILINNAGVIYSHPLINIMNREQPVHSFNSFKKIIDINLNAVFLMGSIVAEKMAMNRTRGIIINISSICSEGNAGQSAYSAAKAGVNALTKTWAKELGAFGIRVVAISPGFIETESTLSSLNTNLLDSIKNRIPMKRLGTPQSVAKLILSTIENEYINGAILSIDGGCSL